MYNAEIPEGPYIPCKLNATAIFLIFFIFLFGFFYLFFYLFYFKLINNIESRILCFCFLLFSVFNMYVCILNIVRRVEKFAN